MLVIEVSSLLLAAVSAQSAIISRPAFEVIKADLAEKINFSRGGPVHGATSSPMIFKLFSLSSGFALTIREARRECRISLRNRNIQSAHFAPPDGAGIQRDAIDGACGRYEIVTNGCCENITMADFCDLRRILHRRTTVGFGLRGSAKIAAKKISKKKRNLRCMRHPLPEYRDIGIWKCVGDSEIVAAGLCFRHAPAHAPTSSLTAPRDHPDRFWSRLAMISAWGDGTSERPLNELGRRFPGVRVQPKGIIATEAFVSLPFRGEYPLAITSHFFEFQLENGEVLPSWRLERGMHGSPVVTTAGGLYRYRIDDILKVTGHIGATPCVRFIAKRGLVSDLVGEKLDEAFVAEVIASLLRAREVETPFALLAPTDIRAGYTLFIEGIDGDHARSLADELDARLSENVHYALARRLCQLAAAQVLRVRKGAAEAYLERMCRERGQRRGDVKPLSLSPLRGREAWLDPQAGAKALHTAK